MTESDGNLNSRKRARRRTLLTGGAFVLGFIVLGVIAIEAWEYTNSVPFCSNVCHNVHPEEPAAYQDSYHAQVKCVECHMGRLSTLRSIVLKTTHFRHLPEVLFHQYARPLESKTLRPPNESCERCHWPPAFHGDTVREIRRFLPDEQNTERDIFLILKTGGGERSKGLGYGIHWHISNLVEYIATDEQKQDIRWIRTTLPDGRTVEYNDVTNPLTPEEIANATPKVMDCVDCHNRVGHPFSSPEDLADDALATGQLSQELPYAKQEVMDVLGGDYPNQEAAIASVDTMRARYEAEHPDVAAEYLAEIDRADELAKQLVTRLVFETPGVTWRSFPDNAGHKNFPGCFRCHDGKHLSSDGEAIRLQCNICHAIPVVVGADARTPQMPVATVQEPPSHLETNFIADHRFQASDACVVCHGEIHFGSDNSSFCANSACHGQAWPMVNLNAAFPHPIPLEGKHAGVWCYECHQGVAKPEYKCANCHQPPMEPHFGPNCEDCHTTAGFEQATMGDFQHPMPLEGAHANLDCADCHAEGKSINTDCATCHQPPSEPHFGNDCAECHQPTSFDDVSFSLDLHPVELVGAHRTAPCEGCHVEGQEMPEFVCSNCHEPPANHLAGECSACHTPEGWASSASGLVDLAPQILHDLEGRDNCLQCHDPQGQIKPAPSSHVGYTVQQCVLCHRLKE